MSNITITNKNNQEQKFEYDKLYNFKHIPVINQYFKRRYNQRKLKEFQGKFPDNEVRLKYTDHNGNQETKTLQNITMFDYIKQVKENKVQIGNLLYLVDEQNKLRIYDFEKNTIPNFRPRFFSLSNQYFAWPYTLLCISMLFAIINIPNLIINTTIFLNILPAIFTISLIVVMGTAVIAPIFYTLVNKSQYYKETNSGKIEFTYTKNGQSLKHKEITINYSDYVALYNNNKLDNIFYYYHRPLRHKTYNQDFRGNRRNKKEFETPTIEKLGETCILHYTAVFWKTKYRERYYSNSDIKFYLSEEISKEIIAMLPKNSRGKEYEDGTLHKVEGDLKEKLQAIKEWQKFFGSNPTSLHEFRIKYKKDQTNCSILTKVENIRSLKYSHEIFMK